MSMRITNLMMVDSMITNINQGLNKLNDYNNKVSTNRNIVNLSDDPAGVLASMTARLNISSIERYQDNVVSSRAWVEQSETALYDINEVLISIKELTIDAMGVKNETDLANIAVEIEQLTEHIMQNLNAVVGDKYIFGGFNTTSQPFEKDETTGKILYNGIDLSQVYNQDGTVNTAVYEQVYGTIPAGGVEADRGTTPETRGEIGQILEFEIGFEMNMQVSFTGIEILGISNHEQDPANVETFNIFDVLHNLTEALNNPTDSTDEHHYLASNLEQLDIIRDEVMKCIVEVGAKTSTLDMMESRYSVDLINNESTRSQIEDIDAALEISKMKFAETAYEQALAVGARVIQPTLLDFLN